jgi:hypothetical protein
VSLWPTERKPLAGLRQWPRAVARAVRGLRGQVAQHTLLLDAQGVRAWRTGLSRRTDARHAAPVASSSIAAWCAANPGSDVRMLVSGHLLHSLVIDPALQLQGDDAAVRRYAQQQFAHYHGAAARQWPLAPWSDSAGAGACALHSVDLAVLQSTAAGHAVRLRSVVPLWSAGLASLSACTPAFAAPGRLALALVEATLVTWIVVDAGRIQALQQRYLDGPRMDALAGLLSQLVAESGPLQALPIVVGWGLEDSGHAAHLPARVCLPLSHPTAHAEWVLDTMRAAP